MSHDSVLSALKELLRHDLLTLPPKEQREHVANESDRTAIILIGAMVERFVLEALINLMGNANADEQSRIFNYEGPCGSFANRIRLAHALGLFDRPTKRSVEIVKEMRNAAAHCVAPLSFETPAIRAAVAQLVPTEHREVTEKLDAEHLKRLFDRICARLNMMIIKPDETPPVEDMFYQALGEGWRNFGAA